MTKCMGFRRLLSIMFACGIAVPSAACANDKPVSLPERIGIMAVGIPLGVALAPILAPIYILDRDAADAARAHPANERPMYAGIQKTAEMLKADDEFIKTIETRYSRADGSDKMTTLGWSYFFKKDYATAMKRFNQAWLLDPDNGDAFHGFALVVVERDKDVTQADTLFQQGLGKARKSPGIYLDYGRFLLRYSRPRAAVPVLRTALSFPDMGPDAEALLALSLNASGDVAGACVEAAKVQDGAQPVIRDRARAILKKDECRA